MSCRSLLRNPDIQRDPKRYLQAVQKVIACMTLGIDVSKLFSEMIMVRGRGFMLPILGSFYTDHACYGFDVLVTMGSK